MGQTAPRDSSGVKRDTSIVNLGDSLKYPIQDRRGDPFSNPRRSSMDLHDPKNLKDSVEYDPKTQRYYIMERIGSSWYRTPTYLTFDEFMRLRAKQLEDE